MKRNFINSGIFVMLLLATTFYSCSDNDGTGRIIVRLTDSPGDYEEVNVDIVDVQVHASNSAGQSGWVSLPNVNKGIYNLLDLTNGRETVLTSAEYPTGKIGQIRLVLGNNNSVKIDGTTYALETPSAMQSGLKLVLNANLLEGITYSVLLDFDAARSIVKTGSNKYILKPVIHVVAEAMDGAISGEIAPADINVAVYAISGADTVKSSYVMNGGREFFLGGLATATYTVAFDPGELSAYEVLEIKDVAVTDGSITELGLIELQEK